MISLHVSLWKDGDHDRFKVTAALGEEQVDVTADYEVVAIADESGRQGFAVFAKEGE